MRSRREGLVNMRDSYKIYIAKAEAPIVDIKVYLLVVGMFMKYIASTIINGGTIKLLEKLGFLYNRGKKLNPSINEDGNITGLPPNWKATKELWARKPEAKEAKQVIFYFNEHTQGNTFSVSWSKKMTYLENIKLYNFTFSRANKRAIPKAIANGVDYPIHS